MLLDRAQKWSLFIKPPPQKRKSGALRDEAVHLFICASVRLSPETRQRVSQMFPLREIYACGGGLLVASLNAPRLFFCVIFSQRLMRSCENLSWKWMCMSKQYYSPCRLMIVIISCYFNAELHVASDSNTDEKTSRY